MKFTTSIEAINPHTGQLDLYEGPVIEAASWDQAQLICDTHGLGYCRVDGEFTGESIFLNKFELN